MLRPTAPYTFWPVPQFDHFQESNSEEGVTDIKVFLDSGEKRFSCIDPIWRDTLFTSPFVILQIG